MLGPSSSRVIHKKSRAPMLPPLNTPRGGCMVTVALETQRHPDAGATGGLCASVGSAVR